jgi:NitT/TauT family transport system substrate-binding protein
MIKVMKSGWIIVGVVFLILAPAPDLRAQLSKVYVAHPAATLSDAPFYIALDKGFYQQEKYEVLSIFVTGGPTGAQALIAGSIHFSLALGSGTRAAMVGAPLKGIFGFNEKPIFSLYGRPDLGVKTQADLQGKTIAVTGIGSSTDYAARAILSHFGLKPEKDATIVALGGGMNVWSALETGRVQAAILWPPFDVLAIEKGMKKILYLGDIIKLPASGVVTSDRLLQEEPGLVKGFLRATLRGLRFFQNEANREENSRIMAKAFKLERNVALRTYDFLRGIQTSDGILPPEAIRNEIEIARGRIKDPKIAALATEDLAQRMFNFAPLSELVQAEKKP